MTSTEKAVAPKYVFRDERVVIDENGDLQLTIVDVAIKPKEWTLQDARIWSRFESQQSSSSPKQVRRVTFKTKRQTLMDASPMLQAMLAHPNSGAARSKMSWQEGSQNTVIFKERMDVTAVEVWLRVIHNCSITKQDIEKVDSRIMWKVVHVAQYLLLPLEKMVTFFDEWEPVQFARYLKLRRRARAQGAEEEDPQNGPFGIDIASASELMFLYYKFDKASRFAWATAYLVYNSRRHIGDTNPTIHKEMGLPHRVISSLNGAKGRLRTVLTREISKPVEGIITGETVECACAPSTHTHYVRALYRAVGVYPFEDVYNQNSMMQILRKLQKFYYKVPDTSCDQCRSIDFNGAISRARSTVHKYFDGICLDCMEHSAHKSVNGGGAAYWACLTGGGWDEDCRINHGQSSWYWSYNGRPDEAHKRDRVHRQ